MSRHPPRPYTREALRPRPQWDAAYQLEVLKDLAVAVLELADVGGMPDTYRQTDSRVNLAKRVLKELGVHN